MHHAPATLRDSGYKLTPQRLLIWHVLQQGRHLSIDQIRAELEEHMYGVDLSTIYRTLDLLLRLNLVREIRLRDGRSLYEAVPESDSRQPDHYHFACESCGAISDFTDPAIHRVAQKALEKGSSHPHSIDMTVYGLCMKCAAEKGK